MNEEVMEFPAYRKYRNGRSYFKIINLREFEEVQLVGKLKIKKHHHVNQFPELNFIRDLLYNFSEMAEEIDETEYRSVSG